MKINKQNLILVSLIVFISICEVKTVHAGFIDKIKEIFAVSNETEAKINEIEETKIAKDIEEYLDSKQKEVVSKIEDIYSDIQNVDLDEIADSIDYKLPTQIMSNLEHFFDNYADGLRNLKSILGTLKYKIVDIRNEGNRVIAKVTYTYPSIPKLITKVLPEIIMKNASILFGAEINNDTIDSALASIKKELEKGSYEVETFTREFVFEQFGDDWKIVKVDDIVKDATKYINDIGKSFFK